jgi:hypothetical protein
MRESQQTNLTLTSQLEPAFVNQTMVCLTPHMKCYAGVTMNLHGLKTGILIMQMQALTGSLDPRLLHLSQRVPGLRTRKMTVKS